MRKLGPRELKFPSPDHPDLWAIFTRLSLFKFSSLLYEGLLLMVSQTRVVQSVFAAGGAGSPGGVHSFVPNSLAALHRLPAGPDTEPLLALR